MRTNKYSEQQIIGFLNQATAGMGHSMQVGINSEAPTTHGLGVRSQS